MMVSGELVAFAVCVAVMGSLTSADSDSEPLPGRCVLLRNADRRCTCRIKSMTSLLYILPALMFIVQFCVSVLTFALGRYGKVR